MKFIALKNKEELKVLSITLKRQLPSDSYGEGFPVLVPSIFSVMVDERDPLEEIIITTDSPPNGSNLIVTSFHNDYHLFPLLRLL